MKSILNNKHKYVAIIVAPILAIGGYGLADLYMTSKEEVNYLKLFPKGDCVPTQSACEVEGPGITVFVTFDEQPSQGQQLPVTVTSMTRLDDVGLSLVNAGQETAPVGATADSERKVWQTRSNLVHINTSEPIKLRLAISEKGNVHLGEIPLRLP